MSLATTTEGSVVMIDPGAAWMKFEVCVSAERFDAKDVCVVWVRPTGVALQS
jgi:hypothetical protein